MKDIRKIQIKPLEMLGTLKLDKKHRMGLRAVKIPQKRLLNLARGFKNKTQV